jgi:hypothetical protein
MAEIHQPRTDVAIDDSNYPPTPHLERLNLEVKDRLNSQRAEFDDLQRLVAAA